MDDDVLDGCDLVGIESQIDTVGATTKPTPLVVRGRGPEQP